METKPFMQVTKSLKRLNACMRSARKSNHPKRWQSETQPDALATADCLSTFASVVKKNSRIARLQDLELLMCKIIMPFMHKLEKLLREKVLKNTVAYCNIRKFIICTVKFSCRNRIILLTYKIKKISLDLLSSSKVISGAQRKVKSFTKSNL